jgi:hypothetical protein
MLGKHNQNIGHAFLDGSSEGLVKVGPLII